MEILIGDKTYAAGRVFCIGMNYRAHIEEMGGVEPPAPVVFMKPATSLVPEGEPIPVPTHGRELHHEVELVLAIGREGKGIPRGAALDYVTGFTLGLDLTLRDVQSRLKQAGHPWEAAKSFDASAPVGTFQPYAAGVDLGAITMSCRVDGELRQEGSTARMIHDCAALVAAASEIWKLLPGDLIYTGTPPGIGPLRSGQTVTVASPQVGEFSWGVQ